MLVELSLRNFGLIPSLTIPLEPGFNVFTGESGAGKSMVIDALQLLVGGRASHDYVRKGENKAEIEGLFHLPLTHPCWSMLEQLGIELSDNSLILSREISTNGKNVCRINGRLVTLSTLRDVGQTLLQIQDQHEQHDLLEEGKHLSVLDRFVGKEIEHCKSAYQHLYDQLISINNSLEKLEENERQAMQQLDFLKFQHEEIMKSELEIGEDERLEKEKRIKSNAQKLSHGIGQAIDALYGERGAYDQLSLALTCIQTCDDVDDSQSSLS
jgi:DNA repair protein RecN (Recombination protein N)